MNLSIKYYLGLEERGEQLTNRTALKGLKESEHIFIVKFWESGEIISEIDGIVLRKVKEGDKESFLKIQKENALIPSMFKEESFQNSLWKVIIPLDSYHESHF